MKVSSRDSLHAERTLQEARLSHHYAIRLYEPVETVCTTCGFDAFLQSGLKADCPECNGTGKTVTHKIYSSQARVSWPKLTDFIMGLAGNIEVGDVSVTVHEHEKAQYERIRRLNGYLLIDGERYAITTISPAGLGDVHEYIVTCGKQTQ